MGAILDNETLSQFPAPSSNLETRSLPGNLGDLECYYSEWFSFSGYEESVSFGNEEYRAYIVTVRNKQGGGDLLSMYIIKLKY